MQAQIVKLKKSKSQSPRKVDRNNRENNETKELQAEIKRLH